MKVVCNDADENKVLWIKLRKLKKNKILTNLYKKYMIEKTRWMNKIWLFTYYYYTINYNGAIGFYAGEAKQWRELGNMRI